MTEKINKTNGYMIAFGLLAIGLVFFVVDGFDIGEKSICGINQIAIIDDSGKWQCSSVATKIEDLRFPVTSVRLAGSTIDASYETFIGGTVALGFDDSLLNEGYISMQLPHSRKENTSIKFHYHWSPTTTNTGFVQWCVEYTCANINDVFPLTSTKCVLDQADGTINKHQMTDYIEVNNTLSFSAQCQARIFRNATNDLDNYTDIALLHEFDLHYQAYSIGSVH